MKTTNLKRLPALFILLGPAFLSSITATSAMEPRDPADVLTFLASDIPGGVLKIEEGTGIGIYPQLFYEAAADARVHLEFRSVPWERAFHKVSQSTDLLTFTITRLPHREGLYTWLTPLDHDEIVFVSLDNPVNTLEEGRALDRVLVWRGSSMEDFLTKKGFKNLTRVSQTDSLIRMLSGGRAHAWFTVRPEKEEVLDSNGNTVKLIYGEIVHKESVWLVGGKAFAPTDASRRFTGSLKKLIESGRLKDLKLKHKR